MKKTKLNVAILAATTIVSNTVFASSDDFVVVVDKYSKYGVLPGSIIPSDSILASILNNTTLDKKTGNILVDELKMNAEPLDLITITTDIIDKQNEELSLSGEWSSVPNISFLVNEMDELVFESPEYDGNILLTLKLEDGIYENKVEKIVINNEHWTEMADVISEWHIDNIDQDWSPSLSTRYENELVTETRIIDRSRTIQEKEIRLSTGEERNSSELITEVQDDFADIRKESYGLLEYWEQTDPIIVQDWTIKEVFKDWSPDASTVYETESVDQSREVKKERIIKTQEIRPKTGVVRLTSGNISDTTVEFEYRTIDGELEYWENVGQVTCTEWVFDRNEEWLPSSSEYPRSESVDQTRQTYERRECSGQQYRPKTGEYRVANEETQYQNTEETRTVFGTQINLNDWGTTDAITVGEWSVSQDGSYAYQAINGAPTFFKSAAKNYENSVIKGRMRVRSAAGDNDWIGMALGMQNSNDFYLWSWKNGSNANSAEKEGHNFAKVTNKSAINWNMHASVSGYNVLSTKHGTAYGWNHDNYHDFEVHYSSSNVKIYIDGSKVIDVNGTFPSGQIAFFNYSQGQVEYYKITEDEI